MKIQNQTGVALTLKLFRLKSIPRTNGRTPVDIFVLKFVEFLKLYQFRAHIEQIYKFVMMNMAVLTWKITRFNH